MTAMDTQEKIKQQVTGNAVVLYMKGTPQFPQCGFSALAVQVLNACGVGEFHSVNVLADPEIRQGIKEFANWPTIPQLYVKGEFVGNPRKHLDGTLAAARAQSPDSAGSQFYFALGPIPHLDGQYTVFGKVLDGMDVADKIVSAKRNAQDRPDNPVAIESITIRDAYHHSGCAIQSH